MDYKVEFENYPQMTRLYNKECGYTVEEVEQISKKQMINGMSATISLQGQFIKTFTK